MDLELSGT
jgi:hypothetical protein